MLVKVHVSPVNRTGCRYRAAHPFPFRAFSGWRRPKRTILGTEFAGVVAAMGSEVSRFEVGEPGGGTVWLRLREFKRPTWR